MQLPSHGKRRPPGIKPCVARPGISAGKSQPCNRPRVAGRARRRAVPRASGARPEEEPSRLPLRSVSAAEGEPSAAEHGAADSGEPAVRSDDGATVCRGASAAGTGTGRRATAPTPPPEPRTLRGSPRRDGRARALRPHCVAGAAWPSARGAPRAGSGAARAGRGGGRGERLFIAREAPPARAALFRGSLACVLRRADGRGFHAEPVRGAASALRGGQERAVAASGDSPKDARVESPSAVTFHRAEVSGGHLVSGCPLVSGTLCLSVPCSPLREGGARSRGLSPSGAMGRPPSGAGGGGRSRQAAGIPEIPLFRERAAPALGTLPAPKKLHIETAAGAAVSGAWPHRGDGGEASSAS